MTDKQELLHDGRFRINPDAVEMVTSRPIKRYKLSEIQVGKIRRMWKNRVFSLYRTTPYKYLMKKNDPEVKEAYSEYCERSKMDNPNRSEEVFNELEDDFDIQAYDIAKGVIIVDQLSIIVDGQHRSCILLKKYGEKCKIPVLRLYYAKYSLSTRFFNLMYIIKRFFRIPC